MNWERAQGSAAEMLESVSTDSRRYPQVRGARFAEGGVTGMPRMTLRLRYRVPEASRAVLGLAADGRGAAAAGLRGRFETAGGPLTCWAGQIRGCASTGVFAGRGGPTRRLSSTLQGAKSFT